MSRSYDTKKEVKAMRDKLGLSQVAFSNLLNIPRRTIESWEAGERSAPKYVIDLLWRAVKEEAEKNETKPQITMVKDTVYVLSRYYCRIKTSNPDDDIFRGLAIDSGIFDSGFMAASLSHDAIMDIAKDTIRSVRAVSGEGFSSLRCVGNNCYELVEYGITIFDVLHPADESVDLDHPYNYYSGVKNIEPLGASWTCVDGELVFK